MNSKQEILDRITLLMNYDSSKTLNENKNIISNNSSELQEAGPGAIKDVETVLKDLKGSEITALKNALKDIAKKGQLLKTDGTVFRYNPETALEDIKAALDQKILSPSTIGRLRTGILKRSYIRPETQAALIDDLTNYKDFVSTYKPYSREEIILKLKKAKYSQDQAEKIADAYIKKRGYDKPPTTPEEFASAEQAAAANKAEREAAAGAEVPPVTAVDAEAKSAADAISKPAEVGNKTIKMKQTLTGPDGQVYTSEVELDLTNLLNQGEKTLGESSATGVKNAEQIIEKEAVETTEPSILRKFAKGARVFILAKKGLMLIGGVVMVGAAWILLRKLKGLADAILADPLGNPLGLNQMTQSNQGDQSNPNEPSGYNSTWDNPGGYVGSNDMSAANAAAAETNAPAVETDRRNQVAPQGAPTSSLSLSNIAQNVNAPQKGHGDPNAVSPELRASLINRIQNDKRYKGEDLQPNERAFVDQYIKSMGNRLPSKEKIKYQMTKDNQSSKPMTQDIKYGYKQ